LIGLAYRPFLHHLNNFDAPIQKLTGGSHGAMYAVVIAMTVLGAPLFEELFFRGVLLQAMVGFSLAVFRKTSVGLSIAVAVLFDGLLFGASHAELAQLPGLVAVGGVLSLCYLWTGRLGLSILTHVGFNSVAIAAYSSGVVLWLH
jgi:membrane protease YdiL (CAAX protease family)